MRPIVVIILLILQIPDAQSQPKTFEIPNTQVFTVSNASGDRTHNLFVKLPLSYDSESSDIFKYPVIYLTDGPTAFPLVSSAIQLPMNSGKLEEAIIVGISWQKGFSPNDSRIQDYTPSVAETWDRSTGGAKDFLAFLTDYVMPFIEERYRANPDKRIFGGHSLGGLFGAYVLASKPDTFSGYILGSPSLWFNNHAIFDAVSKMGITEVNRSTRVFLGVGSLESPEYSGAANDLLKDTQRFFSLLGEIGKDPETLHLYIVPGAIHETAYPATIVRGIHWLLQI